MPTWSWIIVLTAAYPLARAWQANRHSSLVLAVSWGMGAWAAWLTAALVYCYGPASLVPGLRYLAVCLTGCAAVAVLGARRPGVGAWNFVVVGLLSVLLLQWFEGLDRLRDAPIRPLFLAATVGVGVVNYLPTRLGLAALLLGAGCALQVATLVWPESRLGAFEQSSNLSGLLAGASTWLALAIQVKTRPPANALDAIWLDFRDRFGLVWGQRVREQFNRSAAHAGWTIQLDWWGMRPVQPPGDDAVATLRAVLKRFEGDEFAQSDS